MQDKIIAAIKLYLASEMHVRTLADSTIFITSRKFDSGIDAIKSTAAEIAAAIAPLVNMQAQAFAGWICHQVVAGRTYHKLWLDYCEEKAIAPLVEAGGGLIGRTRHLGRITGH